MNIALRTLPLPALPEPESPGTPLPAEIYEHRLDTLYAAAQADWVFVYADREHNANLIWLCNFDPRFEEALLVLGPGGLRVLVLGNEGMGYTSACVPRMRFVLAQTFGLMGQTRAEAPRLDAVLRGLGLAAGAGTAFVGWKYLEPEEDDDPAAPAFVPSFIVRQVRRIAGPHSAVKDATHLLMHPTRGLRALNGAGQIAQFEQAAMLASNAVQRVLRGVRPGMREIDAAATLFAHNGLPYACHPMLNGTPRNQPVVGLRSPGTRVLQPGDGMACAIGYLGGLSCRAGLLQAEPDESFVTQVAVPYFGAIAAWWQTLRIGVTGGEIHAAVLGALQGVPWKPALNPGHLISHDEWMHTPIRPGSGDVLASGMAIQCDIIPAPMPNGWAINCEDGVALADAGLRAELAAHHPALWARVQARRAWLRDCAGLTLHESVLPLSNAAGALAPFWLAADGMCAAVS